MAEEKPKPSVSESAKPSVVASSDNVTTPNNPAALVEPTNPNADYPPEAGNVVLPTGPGTVQDFLVEGRPVNEEPEPVKPEREFVDTNFHYPTELDPMRQVPGTSQYLDREQRERAEILRAKVEDREPDLENPPATQSTPLVNEATLAPGAVPVGKEADVVLPVAHTLTEPRREDVAKDENAEPSKDKEKV